MDSQPTSRSDPPEPLVCVRAHVLEVHDGDTYRLLLDVLNNRFQIGAVTAPIRLRDYSCPELSERGGQQARDIASQLLAGADEVLVELKGQRSFGRLVGWVWVDGDPLGPLLVQHGAARPGAFMGSEPPAQGR